MSENQKCEEHQGTTQEIHFSKLISDFKQQSNKKAVGKWTVKTCTKSS